MDNYQGNDLTYTNLYDEFWYVLVNDVDNELQTWQDVVRACAYQIETLNSDDLELCKDVYDDVLIDLGYTDDACLEE